jgi:hypothetical protein
LLFRELSHVAEIRPEMKGSNRIEPNGAPVFALFSSNFTII